MFKKRKRGGMKDNLQSLSQLAHSEAPALSDSVFSTKTERLRDSYPDGEELDAVEQSFLTPYASRFVRDRNAPRWHELQEVSTGVREHILGHVPLVDFHRDTLVAKAFDLLRTRLRQTVKQNGWTNIAVASPTSGCGNTFSAVNLAMSLSRIPSSRTVLMDFNLRNPGISDAFDMDGRGPIKEYLNGSTPMVRHMARVSDTLAVGLNNEIDPDAAETLQDPATLHTLERMRKSLRPEIVLFDMPPLLVHDDVAAFLPQLDGVLLVSDGTQTMAKHIKECERILAGQVPLLGVILNRARASSIESFD